MTLTQLFTLIANAIRNKTGSSSKIIAEDFPDEISNISTGTDTSDATATANDILENKTAYADGEKLTGTYRWDNTAEYNQCLSKANTILEDDTYNPIQLQEKSVIITQTGTQTITPDTGYDGMSELEITTNVEAFPTMSSFNDYKNVLTQCSNKFITYLENKINSYPTYTDEPVTLYTPTSNHIIYMIHKRSNGKYRIIWSKNNPYIVIENNTSLGFRKLYQSAKDNFAFNDWTSTQILTSETDSNYFYYSNEFDSPEQVIEAIKSPTGDISYTKWYRQGANFSGVLDTPYEITYCNGNIFDLRNNGAVLMSKRISANETFEVKQ